MQYLILGLLLCCGYFLQVSAQCNCLNTTGTDYCSVKNQFATNRGTCSMSNPIDVGLCLDNCQSTRDNDPSWPTYSHGSCNPPEAGICYCQDTKLSTNCDAYCKGSTTDAGDAWEEGKCYDFDEDGDLECVCSAQNDQVQCVGDPGYTTSAGVHFISHVLFKHVLMQTKDNVPQRIPKFTLYGVNECGMWTNGVCQFANPWVTEFHLYGQVFNISFTHEFTITIEVNGGPKLHEWEYRGEGNQYISFRPRDANLDKYDLITDFGLTFYWSNGRFAGNNRHFYINVPRVNRFTNTLEGVMGVFNRDNDTTNDLQLPSGEVFQAVDDDYEDFMQAWHAKLNERGLVPKRRNKRTCKPRIAKFAEKVCTGMLHPDTSPFKECFKQPFRPQWVEDLALAQGEARVNIYMTHWFYQSYLFETSVRARAEANRLQCVHDVCLMEKPGRRTDTGACGFIHDFVEHCQSMKAGMDVDFGNWQRENGVCLEDQGAICPKRRTRLVKCLEPMQTCADVKRNKNKTKRGREAGGNKRRDCRAGCACAKGYVLDTESGQCIRRRDCPGADQTNSAASADGNEEQAGRNRGNNGRRIQGNNRNGNGRGRGRG